MFILEEQQIFGQDPNHVWADEVCWRAESVPFFLCPSGLRAFRWRV